MTICVVDTSVLCELLAVPLKSQRPKEAQDAFAEKSQARERFILPLATIVETGNHIAHVDDGHLRRRVAEDFAKLVLAALDGSSPFTPTPMPDLAVVRTWLDLFVADATSGMGIADRSLIAVWEEQRALHQRSERRVYIWSYDGHLSAYDTRAQ